MRVANREETQDAVIYTYAKDEDPDVSVFTIYKTDPVSYSLDPSPMVAAEIVASSWEEFVAQYDNSGIDWNVVVGV